MEDGKLPWPHGLPPCDAGAAIVASHGPGIALFGRSIIDALQCHVEGIEGVTPQELAAIAEWSGGAIKWNSSVANCVTAVVKQPGGLLFNWFTLGVARDGPYGICSWLSWLCPDAIDTTCSTRRRAQGWMRRCSSRSLQRSLGQNVLRGRSYKYKRRGESASSIAQRTWACVPRAVRPEHRQESVPGHDTWVEHVT